MLFQNGNCIINHLVLTTNATIFPYSTGVRIIRAFHTQVKISVCRMTRQVFLQCFSICHFHCTFCPQNPHQCGYDSLLIPSPHVGQCPYLTVCKCPSTSTGFASCFVSSSSAISCAHGSTSVAVFMWSMSDCTDTLYFPISSLSFSEKMHGAGIEPADNGFSFRTGRERFTSFLFPLCGQRCPFVPCALSFLRVLPARLYFIATPAVVLAHRYKQPPQFRHDTLRKHAHTLHNIPGFR